VTKQSPTLSEFHTVYLVDIWEEGYDSYLVRSQGYAVKMNFEITTHTVITVIYD
jgi:hypothetical protein